MYNLTIKDIIEQCNGKLIFGNPETECINYSKDTRQINKDDVYIGIKGENFDGNKFFEQALESGAKACILQDVEIDESIINKYKDRAIIVVDDTIKALQKMAEFKRSKYDIPVVGVTGSVGKTSTRDMIASVVSQKYNVLKTEGNLNNHIGLPLTILRLQSHNAMVVEMGMNNLGEIHLLSKIAKPTIAVITNVGTAHIGNLGSRQNILTAKLEILDGLKDGGTLIINNDNDLLHNWSEQNDYYKVQSFGIENSSNFEAHNIQMGNDNIKYELISKNKSMEINIPILNRAFIYNSLAAVCVGDILGISTEKIQKGIKEFELTKSRMEVIKGESITIVNDCYNANFDSMKAAIESLSRMQGNKKIAVLGDMLELGEFSKKLHYSLGVEVAKNKIDILITVGEESKNIAQAAIENNMDKNNIHICKQNEEAINLINELKRDGDIVLIKASNGMKFIEIVNALK